MLLLLLSFPKLVLRRHILPFCFPFLPFPHSKIVETKHTQINKSICEKIHELVHVDSAMASAASERVELAKLCSSRNWSKAIRVLDSLLAQSCVIQDIWFVHSFFINLSFRFQPYWSYFIPWFFSIDVNDVKNVDFGFVTAIELFVIVNWSCISTWLRTVTRRFSLTLLFFKLISSKVSLCLINFGFFYVVLTCFYVFLLLILIMEFYLGKLLNL